MTGHNRIERTNRNQIGDTAMVTLGRLSSCVLDPGVDYAGLVQCSWILVGSAKEENLDSPCISTVCAE